MAEQAASGVHSVLESVEGTTDQWAGGGGSDGGNSTARSRKRRRTAAAEGEEGSAAAATSTTATAERAGKEAAGGTGSARRSSRRSEEDPFREINRVQDIARHFEVLQTIGSGTFSTVFKARFRHEQLQGQFVALKCIVRSSSPGRIEREIDCLHRLSGTGLVASVLGIVRQHDTTVLILEYFEHSPFKDYCQLMTEDEVRRYMRALLTALRDVHKSGIIHRDVKPSNFLHNRDTGAFLLADFGLAQKEGDDGVKLDPRDAHQPAKGKGPKAKGAAAAAKASRKSAGVRHTLGIKGLVPKPKDRRKTQPAVRAGTRGFRAPEVLMKCECQSSAIDIWSAGVILMSLLSGRFPMFVAGDDTDAFAELATCFGVEALVKAGKQLGKEVLIGPAKDAEFPPNQIAARKPRERLREICKRLRGQPEAPGWSKPAFDLLARLMELDPRKRATAESALAHEFFAAQPAANV